MTAEQPTLDELRVGAEQRTAMGASMPWTRPMAPDRNLKGLLGERALNRFLGWRLEVAAGPDGGRDAPVIMLREQLGGSFLYRVDVKACASHDDTLFGIPQGQKGAVRPRTIYVLARCNAELTDAELIGWLFGYELARAPIGDPYRKGYPRHFTRTLRPMRELRRLYLGVIER